jgi:hypothetical protein
MPQKSRESPPSDLRELPRQVTCYRCGKQEQGQHPFRLLPGSQYITLCPECYQIIWGGRGTSGSKPVTL